MNYKRIAALLLCNFVTLAVCGGLLPLLPIYAADLGAGPALIGNFLAIAFAGTAVGSMGTGWWSNRFGKRRLLMTVSAVVGIPIVWAMGQVGRVDLLIGLTTILWFLGGVVLTVVGILAGRSAEAHARGRVFGLVALSAAVGGTVGSTVAGPVLAQWGYPVLLTLFAGLWAVQCVSILLLSDWREADVVGAETSASESEIAPAHSAPAGRLFTRPFVLLLSSHFLIGTAFFISSMGRTLAMDGQGMSVAAVSIAAAVGSAAGMVANPRAGYLSDRVNRLVMLALTHVAAGVALVITASAGTLSLFVVAAVLALVSRSGEAVAQALVTDMAGDQSPDRQLSLLATAVWVSGIVGYGGAGYAIQLFDLATTMWAAALLAVVAILLLFGVRQQGVHQQGVHQQGERSTPQEALPARSHFARLFRLRPFRSRAVGA